MHLNEQFEKGIRHQKKINEKIIEYVCQVDMHDKEGVSLLLHEIKLLEIRCFKTG